MRAATQPAGATEQGHRSRGLADRFRELVRGRLLPGLENLGFASASGALAERPADGVRWLVDVEVAPWSNPERICFAASWGVYVPGLASAMGRPDPLRPAVTDCPVRALVGAAGDDDDPTWYQLARRPRLLAFVQDAAVADAFLGTVVSQAVPRLRALPTISSVQDHVFRSLVSRTGLADIDELQSIAQIAAMSHLLGDRQNALRWLDHLRERSCAAMSPEIVEERLAPLRQIVLAS